MEVILSALPSTTAIQGVQGVQGVQPINTGLAAALPSVLANLPPGTLISGFVLNRDVKGNPILRSNVGDFLLESDLFLKIGSDVVVRVDSGGRNANARANIVSVDGLPPEQSEAIPAHAGDADVVSQTVRQNPRPGQEPQQPAPGDARQASAAAPDANASRTRAPVLEGTVVKTPVENSTEAEPAPATKAENTPLPAGAAVRVRVLTVSVAQPVITAPATAPAAESPEPESAPQAAAKAPTQQAAPPAQYNAYTRTLVQTPQAAAPSSAAAPSVQLPSAPVTGEVIRALPNEEVLVRTPLGDIRLQGNTQLAVGAKLTLDILSIRPQILAPVGAEPQLPATAAAQLATNWETLQQTLTAMLDADGPATELWLRTTLPHVPQNVPNVQAAPQALQNVSSGMMFFLSALQGGDVKSLLGERNMKMLQERGHGELLQKLQGEFGLMRQLYADAPPQQWQALFVPVLVEGEVKPLRIYTKRDRKKNEQDARKSEGDTRFIIEMDLTQLGAVQMDGFVKRRPEAATQFDLIIRTHAPLLEEDKREILAIYNATGEITGYRGTLIFQETPVFPVDPMEEILAESHREVVA